MSVFLPFNYRRIVEYAPVSLYLKEILEAGLEKIEEDFILSPHPKSCSGLSPCLPCL